MQIKEGKKIPELFKRQVAQWATIAHLRLNVPAIKGM